MGYSLLVHAGAGSSTGNNVTTAAIDTTGADLIVIAVGVMSYVNPATPTDSQSNTWTALTQYTDGVGGFAIRLYYCQAPTTNGSHTFTESTTGGNPSIAAMAFSGSTASPFDVENGASGFLAAQPGSITPTVDNCVVVAGFTLGTNTGTLTASGMTVSESISAAGGNHVSLGMAYVIQTSAAAINPTWGGENDGNFRALNIASFKPSGGGGGGVFTPYYYQQHIASQRG